MPDNTANGDYGHAPVTTPGPSAPASQQNPSLHTQPTPTPPPAK